MKKNRFPDNFLWGGATADFQFEGGFNEGGRGLNSQDFVTDGSFGAEVSLSVLLVCIIYTNLIKAPQTSVKPFNKKQIYRFQLECYFPKYLCR